MDRDAIKAWLNEIGKSPTDLARALNITPDKVSKSLSPRGTRRFNADEILAIKAMMEAGDIETRSDAIRRAESDLVYIRQVDISFSMGDGAIVDDYPGESMVPFNAGFVRSLTRSSIDNLFIATGHGDSMEPTILRSDMLMVDSSIRTVSFNDQIWALSYAGCGMVKRLRRQRGADGDELVIMSDNPLIPPQVVPLEDVHIVGKLVWIGRVM